jgi:hypothetical protein
MNKIIPMFTVLSIMLLLTVGAFAEAINSDSVTTNSNNIEEDKDDESPMTSGNSGTSVNTNAPTTTGGGGRGGVSLNFVKMKLNPSINHAKPGEWVSYELTIKDLHKTAYIEPVCNIQENVTTECSTTSISPDTYLYKLDNVLGDNVVMELQEREINLLAGETKTMKVSVKAKGAGPHKFIIQATGLDSLTSVKGTIFIKTGPTDPIDPSTPFFSGEGFAISSADETNGKLIRLRLDESDNHLKGKFLIGGQSYRVEGVTSGIKLQFDLVALKSGNVEGHFSGTIQKFSSFTLVEGELDMQQEASYSLTAFSKREMIIREVFARDTNELVSTSINDVIAVSSDEISESSIDEISESSIDEVYIKPIKIRTQKLFGFIPNPWGKKVLDIEVIDGDTIITKTITANKSRQINGYEIQVGSLKDNNNIELNVKKKA